MDDVEENGLAAPKGLFYSRTKSENKFIFRSNILIVRLCCKLYQEIKYMSKIRFIYRIFPKKEDKNIPSW